MTTTDTRDPHRIRLWISTHVGHEGAGTRLYFRDISTAHSPHPGDRVRLFGPGSDQMSPVRSRYFDADGALHVTLAPIVSEPDRRHELALVQASQQPAGIGWWTADDGDIDALLTSDGWTTYA